MFLFVPYFQLERCLLWNLKVHFYRLIRRPRRLLPQYEHSLRVYLRPVRSRTNLALFLGWRFFHFLCRLICRFPRCFWSDSRSLCLVCLFEIVSLWIV